MSDYVELHARSAFSFLRGASAPEYLAEIAAKLEIPALAICDRDGVYGAPRLFGRAKEVGIRSIVGAELTMEDQTILPVLVESRRGYQNLCRLLTRAHLRSEKGKATTRWEELPEFAEGLIALTGDEEGPLIGAVSQRKDPIPVIENLVRIFGKERCFLEIQRHHLRGEDRLCRTLAQLAQRFHLPLLATNGVLYAIELDRPVLDVFTCARNHTNLDAAGKLLTQNSERYLKPAAAMRELFKAHPEAINNTLRLADRLQFTLENLGYEFPAYPISPEHTMDSFLRVQAFAGARERYRGEVPEKVRQQLEKELALIQKLGVAGYFLIVWDIIEFCRQNNIMAQGRGSAANSTVCFCLRITAVDPLKFETLFERFLSEGRKNSWPDIDIDLPSGDRRERVIQEIYRRYGKHGSAMTANVITFRGRSAAREVGKALNISGDVLNRFSNLYANGDFPETLDLHAQMEQSGLPPQHPRATAFATLCKAIHGLPRHLGQHSGGMIISQDKLDTIVPLENASMPNRVVAQWDKDDCEDLGIIKVDFLGLGMMSVLQDSVELTRARGHPVDLANLPPDDPKSFEMMQKADTIGVFQIESRAQMSTLPRMKPTCFYDLVIEVAIIRPGPIQGNLTHPYLERRKDRTKAVPLHPELEPVLSRTLGVPLFQEQMLQIAMVLADFNGSEAEELRRALSFHRSQERMDKVEVKLRAAMKKKGHSQELIDKIAATISSFALYGFPESHAISFAHLVYASAYLKAHHAPEFYASLLNNQPMGFYSSASLIKDAQRHGLKFRPVCVARSDWNCTIESDDSVRLGFRVVRGLSNTGAERLLAERKKSHFTSLDDFKRRVRLNKDELRALASIGALNSLAGHRRNALWNIETEIREDDLFENALTSLGRNGAIGHVLPPHPSPLPKEREHFSTALKQSLKGELVNGSAARAASSDAGFLHNQMVRPLPKGEGRGEGEGIIHQPNIHETNHNTFQRNEAHRNLDIGAWDVELSPLLPMSYDERIQADYTGMQLTTGSHPMALLRPKLPGIWRAADLPKAKPGSIIRIAGNVICRQRPGTARGVVFVSLEDETGISNAIVSSELFETQRLVLTQEAFLIIEGRLQNIDNVIHVKAHRIERLKHDSHVASPSYDFH